MTRTPPFRHPTAVVFTRSACAVAVTLAVSTLVACGGGGGTADVSAPVVVAPASSGTGIGTVTGFGSIIVDGVHYDDRRVVVAVDTAASAPDEAAAGTSVDVKLGQHVELTFTGSEGNSTATKVTVSAEIIGKVGAIAPALVVSGQTIVVNADAAVGPVTVFEGYTAAADIAVGDRVEVHGVPLANGSVQATRIERRPAAEAWLRISGKVAALTTDASSFTLGGETIRVDTGTKVLPTGATLANGQRVAVWSSGAAVGNTVTASIVRIHKTGAVDATDARLAGAITDCTAVCDASFKVAGIAIDASTAEFVGGTKTDLANGKWVELRGTLDLGTGAIKATRVALRRPEPAAQDVSLKGAIADFVDTSHFKVRGTPVTTNANTVIAAACPVPLAAGTLVTVAGTVSGYTVLARTIDCFTSTDGISLEGRGAVLMLDPAAKTFTLAGELFRGLTLSYGDTTVFQAGKSAADLRIGAVVEVKGNVNGTGLAVRRIGFADVLPVNPGAGVTTLETEGIASHVTRGTAGSPITSFAIDGATFTLNGETTVRTLDGQLVDGAKIHVVFKKVGDVNVVLLVNTKH